MSQIVKEAESIDDIDDLNALLKLWQTKKLRYLSIAEQAKCYEEIIRLCKDGYTEHIMSPKGFPFEQTKRDLRTACVALKEYRELINKVRDRAEGDGRVTISINVKEAAPQM